MAKKKIKVPDGPDAKNPTPNRRGSTEVAFHYIKSNNFSVLLADGASGSVTPKGHIQLDFYSERVPIPRTVFHELDKDGKLGRIIEDKVERRQGLVREVGAEILLDKRTAVAIANWILENAKDSSIVE